MVKVKQEFSSDNKVAYKFKARANVNFSLPVNKFPNVRKYNEDYLQQLKEVNGENSRLPLSMNYRPIHRGDILCFGDELIMNNETGYIEVYPVEIYEKMSQMTVDLPCVMPGVVDVNLSHAKALLSPAMQKAIEAHKGDTARFRTRPFLEKYDENSLELED